MSASSSSQPMSPAAPRRTYVWRSLALLAWVVLGFFIATLIVGTLVWLIDAIGIDLSLVNETVLNTVAAALLYSLAALIIIGLPQIVERFKTSRSELGAGRLPNWRDIALAPAAFVVYFIATAIVTATVTHFVPGFNLNEAQDVGFADLSLQYEYILAFLTLVVLAPLAEELLFRGYLYGRLRSWMPLLLAAVVTSVIFGVVHGQWNVGLDVFVLSLVMCGLRELTGGIWAGVLLHMIKNGLAFYILFINPSLLNTIGG